MGSQCHVVQVVPHRSLGGMQEIADLLDANLGDFGIESQIISLRDVTRVRRTRFRAFQLLVSWVDLVRSWRAVRPAVVLAHTALAGLFSLTAASIARVPKRVLVVHTNREHLGRRKTVLTAALVLLGVVSNVIYCGESVASSFRGIKPFLRGRSRVIQNGAKLPGRSPRIRGDREDSGSAAVPIMVTTARLVASKNLMVLIDALPHMRVPARLVICGDGPEEARLRQRATLLGVDVSFQGRLSRDELGRVYELASVFLAPSVIEGLPLVLIEAASFGLPIVAAERAFNREVLGGDAIFVDVDTPSGWASAMDRCLEDIGLRKALVLAGKERAERFSVERMTRDYARFLSS